MRIAVGGYSHETNSFSNNPVTQEVLDQRTWVGEAWFKRYTGVETYHGGFIDEAKELGIRLIDQAPRGGAEGLSIAFLHPKSTFGVLTELCENKNK